MLDVIGHVRKMAFAINRASGYEKNMVVVELAYTDEIAERITDIIPVVRDQGFVVVVSGTDDVMDADGVLLRDIAKVTDMRKKCGEDAIIGLVCDDLDAATLAVKYDVDYVILAADPTLITQFSIQSDVLCVARGEEITNKNCGVLAQAGADLIDVGAYIMEHEKDVMQGAVNILHELDVAAKMPEALN
ncbi:MAG: hypothetical protein COB14_06700 [Alphaproteobacteria bacterium]|nr:MAG: hypothetical protein COB14_06700 [Alphaproteobacteria bacterium]